MQLSIVGCSLTMGLACIILTFISSTPTVLGQYLLTGEALYKSLFVQLANTDTAIRNAAVANAGVANPGPWLANVTRLAQDNNDLLDLKNGSLVLTPAQCLTKAKGIEADIEVVKASATDPIPSGTLTGEVLFHSLVTQLGIAVNTMLATGAANAGAVNPGPWLTAVIKYTTDVNAIHQVEANNDSADCLTVLNNLTGDLLTILGTLSS